MESSNARVYCDRPKIFIKCNERELTAGLRLRKWGVRLRESTKMDPGSENFATMRVNDLPDSEVFLHMSQALHFDWPIAKAGGSL